MVRGTLLIGAATVALSGCAQKLQLAEACELDTTLSAEARAECLDLIAPAAALPRPPEQAAASRRVFGQRSSEDASALASTRSAVPDPASASADAPATGGSESGGSGGDPHGGGSGASGGAGSGGGGIAGRRLVGRRPRRRHVRRRRPRRRGPLGRRRPPQAVGRRGAVVPVAPAHRRAAARRVAAPPATTMTVTMTVTMTTTTTDAATGPAGAAAHPITRRPGAAAIAAGGTDGLAPEGRHRPACLRGRPLRSPGVPVA